MTSSKEPLYFEGSCSNSGDEDDATDVESSDEEEEDVAISREKCEKWIPPVFLKARALLDDVTDLEHTLNQTCIACWCSSPSVIVPHPFFYGGLCSACKDRLLRTMYAKTGEQLVFCVVCGTRTSQSINCSDEQQCRRNYCVNCLYIWTEDGAHWDSIIRANDSAVNHWECFICASPAGRPAGKGVRLIVRPDWWQRVLGFHECLAFYAPRSFNWKKEPLRVLSLFDGIGTGLVALRQLGIRVEVYYASEVLRPAATVSRARLGGGPSTGNCDASSSSEHHRVLRHIGSVGEVTRQALIEMLPIHLLIGGSPCNDFSAINRFPKDFYDPKGACLYVFDFVRVRNLLLEMNGHQHLLWLFENVASMPRSYRQIISLHLDCQPAVIDARDFSPQLRRRYFWGNLPGLYTLPDNLSGDGDGEAAEGSKDYSAVNDTSSRLTHLAQALMPHAGRRAAQLHVRTLTTNTNSLLQGRTEDCRTKKELTALFPVRLTERNENNSSGEEDEEEEEDVDVLWLQEIERVFGFPRHFTDVGNLSRSDRQKLLGHAWSVPVVAHIFAPLKAYTLPAIPGCLEDDMGREVHMEEDQDEDSSSSDN